MSTDARLSTGLPGHPKTLKLVRRLGPAAGWSLVCLILWVRANRADGDLAGMSSEDIELAANWDGEDGALVRELVSVRFLDGDEGEYLLHDWADHQPWSAGSELRSLKATWNAIKRHHGAAEADRQVPEYAKLRATAQDGYAASNASSNEKDASSIATSTDAAVHAASNSTAGSSATAMRPASNSNAPSPSPSPSPKAKAISTPDGVDPPGDDAGARKGAVPPCPHEAIIELWHEVMPDMPRVRAWTGTRERHLQARWREDPDRQSLDSWRELFGWIRKSPFLMGREHSKDRQPFHLTLAWLVSPENFAKVIEGNYHP